MSRSITEMEPGDFVEVAPGRYEEIASISEGVGPGRFQLPKSFHVITTSDRKMDMRQALSYHKREDLRGG